MTALYKIANEYNALCNEDMDPKLIADTLEGIEGEFSDKLEHIMSTIKNQQALSKALKEESKSLADRAKYIDNKIDSMKVYIVSNMMKINKTKMNAGIHSLTVRKPSTSLKIDNIDLIPVEFIEYETVAKVDKNAIKNSIKLGNDVDGVSLVLGKPTLMIK